MSSGQLRSVAIKGYKSIKDCELPLGNINVLIGSNGAGKSNFISVFALLQDVLKHNLQVSVGRSGINSLFYNGIKETDFMSFCFYFDNNSYGFDLIPTDDNRVMFQREYFGYKKEGLSHFTKDVARGNFESQWEIGSGTHYNDYVIPILEQNSWRVYHFHDTSRTAKVKQEHNISNNLSLMFDASNLAAFLYRLKNNYKHSYYEIVETIRLIAPYFDDFVLEPNEGNEELIVLKWHQKGCEDVFNASQLSDGTLRFICLTTLLLQPSELQPATIIVDEPELGLHPYAITIFADMVKQISVDKQVIISTQSVDLLNEFEAEDVVVVDKNADGSSNFQRLNVEELESWLEDYSLGDLWQKNVLGGRLSK